MSALTLSAPQSSGRTPARTRRAASPAQRTSPARPAAHPRASTATASRPAPLTRATVAGPSGSARLTRRGRLVMVAVLTLLLFVGLGALSRVVATATSDASSGPVTRTWVVQPGESLWDVAEAVAPGTDPRETIARIVDLNDLPQSAVSVGQSIQVPVR